MTPKLNLAINPASTLGNLMLGFMWKKSPYIVHVTALDPSIAPNMKEIKISKLKFAKDLKDHKVLQMDLTSDSIQLYLNIITYLFENFKSYISNNKLINGVLINLSWKFPNIKSFEKKLTKAIHAAEPRFAQSVFLSDETDKFYNKWILYTVKGKAEELIKKEKIINKVKGDNELTQEVQNIFNKEIKDEDKDYQFHRQIDFFTDHPEIFTKTYFNINRDPINFPNVISGEKEESNTTNTEVKIEEGELNKSELELINDLLKYESNSKNESTLKKFINVDLFTFPDYNTYEEKLEMTGYDFKLIDKIIETNTLTELTSIKEFIGSYHLTLSNWTNNNCIKLKEVRSNDSIRKVIQSKLSDVGYLIYLWLMNYKANNEINNRGKIFIDAPFVFNETLIKKEDKLSYSLLQDIIKNYYNNKESYHNLNKLLVNPNKRILNLFVNKEKFKLISPILINDYQKSYNFIQNLFLEKLTFGLPEGASIEQKLSAFKSLNFTSIDYIKEFSSAGYSDSIIRIFYNLKIFIIYLSDVMGAIKHGVDLIDSPFLVPLSEEEIKNILSLLTITNIDNKLNFNGKVPVNLMADQNEFYKVIKNLFELYSHYNRNMILFFLQKDAETYTDDRSRVNKLYDIIKQSFNVDNNLESVLIKTKYLLYKKLNGEAILNKSKIPSALINFIDWLSLFYKEFGDFNFKKHSKNVLFKKIYDFKISYNPLDKSFFQIYNNKKQPKKLDQQIFNDFCDAIVNTNPKRLKDNDGKFITTGNSEEILNIVDNLNFQVNPEYNLSVPVDIKSLKDYFYYMFGGMIQYNDDIKEKYFGLDILTDPKEINNKNKEGDAYHSEEVRDLLTRSDQFGELIKKGAVAELSAIEEEEIKKFFTGEKVLSSIPKEELNTIEELFQYAYNTGAFSEVHVATLDSTTSAINIINDYVGKQSISAIKAYTEDSNVFNNLLRNFNKQKLNASNNALAVINQLFKFYLNNKHVLLKETISVRGSASNKWLKGKLAGDYVIEPAFFSTTLDFSIANSFANRTFNFGYYYVIYAPKGARAVYIGNNSSVDGEEELLFAPGSVFKIIKIESRASQDVNEPMYGLGGLIYHIMYVGSLLEEIKEEVVTSFSKFESLEIVYNDEDDEDD